MNKAERIRELFKTGKYTRAQIAEVIGCGAPYVRAALRRRPSQNGAGQSAIDDRYAMKRFGGTTIREAWRNQNRIYRGRRKAEARAS